MSSIAFSIFLYYLKVAPERAVTATFTLFVFLQLFNALNCRSANRSVFSRPFANPYIFLAISISFAIQMAIVYIPPLQDIFKTVALLPTDLAIVIGSALIIIMIEEGKKRVFPQYTAY
jgi:P-type Ca2+ transporter type 2C